DVFRAGDLARHERPLQARGEAGAASSAQGGLLQLGNDVFRLELLVQDLVQRGIAAPRLVVLEAPVRAVEAGHQDRVGSVVEHRHLSSPKSWSSFSLVM